MFIGMHRVILVGFSFILEKRYINMLFQCQPAKESDRHP